MHPASLNYYWRYSWILNTDIFTCIVFFAQCFFIFVLLLYIYNKYNSYINIYMFVGCVVLVMNKSTMMHSDVRQLIIKTVFFYNVSGIDPS